MYEKQQSLGMDYVRTEIKQLIKGIEDGAERTAEIVRGLRTFSRLDESELKIAVFHTRFPTVLRVYLYLYREAGCIGQ